MLFRMSISPQPLDTKYFPLRVLPERSNRQLLFLTANSSFDTLSLSFFIFQLHTKHRLAFSLTLRAFSGYHMAGHAFTWRVILL